MLIYRHEIAAKKYLSCVQKLLPDASGWEDAGFETPRAAYVTNCMVQVAEVRWQLETHSDFVTRITLGLAKVVQFQADSTHSGFPFSIYPHAGPLPARRRL